MRGLRPAVWLLPGPKHSEASVRLRAGLHLLAGLDLLVLLLRPVQQDPPQELPWPLLLSGDCHSFGALLRRPVQEGGVGGAGLLFRPVL